MIRKKKPLEGNDQKKKNSPATILLALSVIGGIAYLIYKHRQSDQPVSLVASMDPQPGSESLPNLQSLHRDQLKEMLSSTSSSNSLKDLIVEELTRRGYTVQRSMADPYTDIKVTKALIIGRAEVSGL